MKIIDDYLDMLYENDDSKEAKEIKEEIKEHLVILVNEYIKEGYETEKAQNKAIEQFDGDSEMALELRAIYSPKIDVRKEKMKKLYSLRWKVINAFGVFVGAGFLAAARNTESIFPTWIIFVISTLGCTILVLSIMISFLKRSINNK